MTPADRIEVPPGLRGRATGPDPFQRASESLSRALDLVPGLVSAQNELLDIQLKRLKGIWLAFLICAGLNIATIILLVIMFVWLLARSAS